MADPWDEAYEQFAAGVDRAVIQLETLEIHHPQIVDAQGQQAVRAVNDVVPHSLRLEDEAPLQGGSYVTFSPIPFEFEFPDFEEGKAPQAQVRIDNIREEVEKYLDGAELSNAPMTVIYRVYLSTNKGKVSHGPYTFIIREIVSEDTAISGRATFANPQNLKFPRKVYTQEEYPTLSQGS